MTYPTKGGRFVRKAIARLLWLAVVVGAAVILYHYFGE